MTSAFNTSDRSGEENTVPTFPLSQSTMTDRQQRMGPESSSLLSGKPVVFSSNKDGGNNNDKQTCQSDSTSSFTIPKIQRRKLDLLSEISSSDYEYQQDILPTLQKSFYYKSSTSSFTFKRIFTVHNNDLMKKFIKRRKSMKSEGYTDKELTEMYGFLAVDSSQVQEICKNGLKVGNQKLSVLGHPEMGVHLCKYADVIPPKPVSFWKGSLIMFRIIKGKVKTVTENLTGIHVDPTPNYDCHVTKTVLSETRNFSPQQIFDFSQIYLYEYEDCNLEDYPSQILCHAVIEFEYRDPKPSQTPISKYIPYSLQPPSCNTTPVSSQLPQSDGPDEEYITWNGKLAVKGTFYKCNASLISTAGYYKPVRLGSTINISKRSDLKSAEVKYFGQLKSIRKNEEMYWRGRYINVGELRPKDDGSKSQFNKIVSYLTKKNSMAIVKPDPNTVMVLLPECSLTNQIGLTCPNQHSSFLHCLFLSRQSAKYKSPKYTANMYKTQGVVLGIQDYKQKPEESIVNTTDKPPFININQSSLQAVAVDFNNQTTCSIPETMKMIPVPSLSFQPAVPHIYQNQFNQNPITLPPPTVTSSPIRKRVGSYPPLWYSPGCTLPAKIPVDYDEGFNITNNTQMLQTFSVKQTFDQQHTAERNRAWGLDSNGKRLDPRIKKTDQNQALVEGTFLNNNIPLKMVMQSDNISYWINDSNKNGSSNPIISSGLREIPMDIEETTNHDDCDDVLTGDVLPLTLQNNTKDGSPLKGIKSADDMKDFLNASITREEKKYYNVKTQSPRRCEQNKAKVLSPAKTNILSPVKINDGNACESTQSPRKPATFSSPSNCITCSPNEKALPSPVKLCALNCPSDCSVCLPNKSALSSPRKHSPLNSPHKCNSCSHSPVHGKIIDDRQNDAVKLKSILSSPQKNLAFRSHPKCFISKSSFEICADWLKDVATIQSALPTPSISSASSPNKLHPAKSTSKIGDDALVSPRKHLKFSSSPKCGDCLTGKSPSQICSDRLNDDTAVESTLLSPRKYLTTNNPSKCNSCSPGKDQQANLVSPHKISNKMFESVKRNLTATFNIDTSSKHHLNDCPEVVDDPQRNVSKTKVSVISSPLKNCRSSCPKVCAYSPKKALITLDNNSLSSKNNNSSSSKTNQLYNLSEKVTVSSENPPCANIRICCPPTENSCSPESAAMINTTTCTVAEESSSKDTISSSKVMALMRNYHEKTREPTVVTNVNYLQVPSEQPLTINNISNTSVIHPIMSSSNHIMLSFPSASSKALLDNIPFTIDRKPVSPHSEKSHMFVETKATYSRTAFVSGKGKYCTKSPPIDCNSKNQILSVSYGSSTESLNSGTFQEDTHLPAASTVNITSESHVSKSYIYLQTDTVNSNNMQSVTCKLQKPDKCSDDEKDYSVFQLSHPRNSKTFSSEDKCGSKNFLEAFDNENTASHDYSSYTFPHQRNDYLESKTEETPNDVLFTGTKKRLQQSGATFPISSLLPSLYSHVDKGNKFLLTEYKSCECAPDAFPCACPFICNLDLAGIELCSPVPSTEGLPEAGGIFSDSLSSSDAVGTALNDAVELLSKLEGESRSIDQHTQSDPSRKINTTMVPEKYTVENKSNNTGHQEQNITQLKVDDYSSYNRISNEQIPVGLTIEKENSELTKQDHDTSKEKHVDTTKDENDIDKIKPDTATTKTITVADKTDTYNSSTKNKDIANYTDIGTYKNNEINVGTSRNIFTSFDTTKNNGTSVAPVKDTVPTKADTDMDADKSTVINATKTTTRTTCGVANDNNVNGEANKSNASDQTNHLTVDNTESNISDSKLNKTILVNTCYNASADSDDTSFVSNITTESTVSSGGDTSFHTIGSKMTSLEITDQHSKDAEQDLSNCTNDSSRDDDFNHRTRNHSSSTDDIKRSPYDYPFHPDDDDVQNLLSSCAPTMSVNKDDSLAELEIRTGFSPPDSSPVNSVNRNIFGTTQKLNKTVLNLDLEFSVNKIQASTPNILKNNVLHSPKTVGSKTPPANLNSVSHFLNLVKENSEKELKQKMLSSPVKIHPEIVPELDKVRSPGKVESSASEPKAMLNAMQQICKSYNDDSDQSKEEFHEFPEQFEVLDEVYSDSTPENSGHQSDDLCIPKDIILPLHNLTGDRDSCLEIGNVQSATKTNDSSSTLEDKNCEWNKTDCEVRKPEPAVRTKSFNTLNLSLGEKSSLDIQKKSVNCSNISSLNDIKTFPDVVVNLTRCDSPHSPDNPFGLSNLINKQLSEKEVQTQKKWSQLCFDKMLPRTESANLKEQNKYKSKEEKHHSSKHHCSKHTNKCKDDSSLSSEIKKVADAKSMSTSKSSDLHKRTKSNDKTPKDSSLSSGLHKRTTSEDRNSKHSVTKSVDLHKQTQSGDKTSKESVSRASYACSNLKKKSSNALTPEICSVEHSHKRIATGNMCKPPELHNQTKSDDKTSKDSSSKSSNLHKRTKSDDKTSKNLASKSADLHKRTKSEDKISRDSTSKSSNLHKTSTNSSSKPADLHKRTKSEDETSKGSSSKSSDLHKHKRTKSDDKTSGDSTSKSADLHKRTKSEDKKSKNSLSKSSDLHEQTKSDDKSSKDKSLSNLDAKSSKSHKKRNSEHSPETKCQTKKLKLQKDTKSSTNDPIIKTSKHLSTEKTKDKTNKRSKSDAPLPLEKSKIAVGKTKSRHQSENKQDMPNSDKSSIQAWKNTFQSITDCTDLATFTIPKNSATTEKDPSCQKMTLSNPKSDSNNPDLSNRKQVNEKTKLAPSSMPTVTSKTIGDNLSEQFKSTENIAERLIKLSSTEFPQTDDNKSTDNLGKSVSQITENRKARQFHPYTSPKKKKKKQWASFNLAVSDLKELMMDLTTTSYQRNSNQYTPQVQKRFLNYYFQRSEVPAMDDHEDLTDMVTAEDILDYEERIKMADEMEAHFADDDNHILNYDLIFEQENEIYSVVDQDMDDDDIDDCYSLRNAEFPVEHTGNESNLVHVPITETVARPEKSIVGNIQKDIPTKATLPCIEPNLPTDDRNFQTPILNSSPPLTDKTEVKKDNKAVPKKIKISPIVFDGSKAKAKTSKISSDEFKEKLKKDGPLKKLQFEQKSETVKKDITSSDTSAKGKKNEITKTPKISPILFHANNNKSIESNDDQDKPSKIVKNFIQPTPQSKDHSENIQAEGGEKTNGHQEAPKKPKFSPIIFKLKTTKTQAIEKLPPCFKLTDAFNSKETLICESNSKAVSDGQNSVNHDANNTSTNFNNPTPKADLPVHSSLATLCSSTNLQAKVTGTKSKLIKEGKESEETNMHNFNSHASAVSPLFERNSEGFKTDASDDSQGLIEGISKTKTFSKQDLTPINVQKLNLSVLSNSLLQGDDHSSEILKKCDQKNDTIKYANKPESIPSLSFTNFLEARMCNSSMNIPTGRSIHSGDKVIIKNFLGPQTLTSNEISRPKSDVIEDVDTMRHLLNQDLKPAKTETIFPKLIPIQIPKACRIPKLKHSSEDNPMVSHPSPTNPVTSNLDVASTNAVNHLIDLSNTTELNSTKSASISNESTPVKDENTNLDQSPKHFVQSTSTTPVKDENINLQTNNTGGKTMSKSPETPLKDEHTSSDLEAVGKDSSNGDEQKQKTPSDNIQVEEKPVDDVHEVMRQMWKSVTTVLKEVKPIDPRTPRPAPKLTSPVLKDNMKDVPKPDVKVTPQKSSKPMLPKNVKGSGKKKPCHTSAGLHPKRNEFWRHKVSKIIFVMKSVEYVSNPDLNNYKLLHAEYLSNDPRKEVKDPNKRVCPHTGLVLRTKSKSPKHLSGGKAVNKISKLSNRSMDFKTEKGNPNPDPHKETPEFSQSLIKMSEVNVSDKETAEKRNDETVNQKKGGGKIIVFGIKRKAEDRPTHLSRVEKISKTDITDQEDDELRNELLDYALSSDTGTVTSQAKEKVSHLKKDIPVLPPENSIYKDENNSKISHQESFSAVLKSKTAENFILSEAKSVINEETKTKESKPAESKLSDIEQVQGAKPADINNKSIKINCGMSTSTSTFQILETKTLQNEENVLLSVDQVVAVSNKKDLPKPSVIDHAPREDNIKDQSASSMGPSAKERKTSTHPKNEKTALLLKPEIVIPSSKVDHKNLTPTKDKKIVVLPKHSNTNNSISIVVTKDKLPENSKSNSSKQSQQKIKEPSQSKHSRKGSKEEKQIKEPSKRKLFEKNSSMNIPINGEIKSKRQETQTKSKINQPDKTDKSNVEVSKPNSSSPNSTNHLLQSTTDISKTKCSDDKIIKSLGKEKSVRSLNNGSSRTSVYIPAKGITKSKSFNKSEDNKPEKLNNNGGVNIEESAKDSVKIINNNKPKKSKDQVESCSRTSGRVKCKSKENIKKHSHVDSIGNKSEKFQKSPKDKSTKLVVVSKKNNELIKDNAKEKNLNEQTVKKPTAIVTPSIKDVDHHSKTKEKSIDTSTSGLEDGEIQESDDNSDVIFVSEWNLYESVLNVRKTKRLLKKKRKRKKDHVKTTKCHKPDGNVDITNTSVNQEQSLKKKGLAVIPIRDAHQASTTNEESQKKSSFPKSFEKVIKDIREADSTSSWTESKSDQQDNHDVERKLHLARKIEHQDNSEIDHKRRKVDNVWDQLRLMEDVQIPNHPTDTPSEEVPKFNAIFDLLDNEAQGNEQNSLLPLSSCDLPPLPVSRSEEDLSKEDPEDSHLILNQNETFLNNAAHINNLIINEQSNFVRGCPRPPLVPLIPSQSMHHTHQPEYFLPGHPIRPQRYQVFQPLPLPLITQHYPLHYLNSGIPISSLPSMDPTTQCFTESMTPLFKGYPSVIPNLPPLNPPIPTFPFQLNQRETMFDPQAFPLPPLPPLPSGFNSFENSSSSSVSSVHQVMSQPVSQGSSPITIPSLIHINPFESQQTQSPMKTGTFRENQATSLMGVDMSKTDLEPKFIGPVLPEGHPLAGRETGNHSVVSRSSSCSPCPPDLVYNSPEDMCFSTDESQSPDTETPSLIDSNRLKPALLEMELSLDCPTSQDLMDHQAKAKESLVAMDDNFFLYRSIILIGKVLAHLSLARKWKLMIHQRVFSQISQKTTGGLHHPETIEAIKRFDLITNYKDVGLIEFITNCSCDKNTSYLGENVSCIQRLMKDVYPNISSALILTAYTDEPQHVSDGIIISNIDRFVGKML